MFMAMALAMGMIIMPMALPRMSPTLKTQHKRENRLEKQTITKKGSKKYIESWSQIHSYQYYRTILLGPVQHPKPDINFKKFINSPANERNN
jgi:hypothetical protein